MVVDIGGGTTEVAVISLGGIVTSQSIRIGGDELDQAIITFGKKEHSLMLGESHRRGDQAGARLRVSPPRRSRPEIRGRDLVSGLPKTILISAAEVRRAIDEPINLIIDAVKSTLDKCPPELAGDVMDRGIALTCGGALLRGLDQRIREETGMPVHIADSPLDSVVLGTGKCVEDFDNPAPGTRSRPAEPDNHAQVAQATGVAHCLKRDGHEWFLIALLVVAIALITTISATEATRVRPASAAGSSARSSGSPATSPECSGHKR